MAEIVNPRTVPENETNRTPTRREFDPLKTVWPRSGRKPVHGLADAGQVQGPQLKSGLGQVEAQNRLSGERAGQEADELIDGVDCEIGSVNTYNQNFAPSPMSSARGPRT